MKTLRPTLARALARARGWPQRLLRGKGHGTDEAVLTAVSFSPAPVLVQVRAAQSAAGVGGVEWQLVAARRADPDTPALAQLKRWRREGVLPRRGAVLVLGGADRYLQTMDRPAVPADELTLAVRWPLAESMEAEPEELLVTALPLKGVNDSGRQQVLAVAGRTAVAKAQLALLAQAGAEVRHIDVIESALRGLALVHARPSTGTIVLFTLGGELAVGLLWWGELCALRSLPLPALEERSSVAWVDQLALQVQRTSDHYERQATQLAVREVLACLPEMSPSERSALCSAMALPTREVPALAAAATPATEAGPGPLPGDATHEALAALVCVGVVRLAEQLAQQTAQQTALSPAAQSLKQPPAAPAEPADAGRAGGRADRIPPTPAQAAAEVLALAASPGAAMAQAGQAQPDTKKSMEWTP